MSASESMEPTDARCLVCEKDVHDGDGFCRLLVDDVMIALCCPLCLETFNKDKSRYETKLSAHRAGLLGDRYFAP